MTTDSDSAEWKLEVACTIFWNGLQAKEDWVTERDLKSRWFDKSEKAFAQLQADGLLEFKGTDVRLTLDGIQFVIDDKIEQLGYVPELDDLDDRYDSELDLLRMYGMRAQRLWDANVDFEPKDKEMMPGFEFRSLMRRRSE